MLAKTRRFVTVAVMFSLSASKRVNAAFAELGQITLLAQEVVASLLKGRASWRDLLYQIYFIGVKSQSVVLITGAFTGMVLGAQTYFQFHKVKMDTATLAVVSVSMCSELGPVLTGLMVAGRVGAAIAAELGTMRVTEQIDALRALAPESEVRPAELCRWFEQRYQLCPFASLGSNRDAADPRWRSFMAVTMHGPGTRLRHLGLRSTWFERAFLGFSRNLTGRYPFYQPQRPGQLRLHLLLNGLAGGGLACALLDRNAVGLWQDRAALGPLLESFVLQELRRQVDALRQLLAGKRLALLVPHDPGFVGLEILHHQCQTVEIPIEWHERHDVARIAEAEGVSFAFDFRPARL